MPHADSTHFASSASKADVLSSVLASATTLLADTRNWVANTANVSSLIWHAYASIGTRVNWAGFYVSHPADPSQLILGPFQGRVACQIIPLGTGVCGTAAAEQKTQVVPDVDAFPGHIACDSESKSEIVVPIVVNGKVSVAQPLACMAHDG